MKEVYGYLSNNEKFFKTKLDCETYEYQEAIQDIFKKYPKDYIMNAILHNVDLGFLAALDRKISEYNMFINKLP